MNRYVFLIVLLSAMGVGVYVFLRDPAPDAIALAPRTNADPPAVAKEAHSAAPKAKATSMPEERPAWMSPPAGSTSALVDRTAANTAESTAFAAEDAKMARIAKVMEKFKQLQSGQDPKPREIAAAIGELETVNGSSVLNGVRLDVLRHNVLVAEKMQTASEELSKLHSAADSKSPQSLALIQARTAELETLRTQLRSDVLEPKAKSAAP